MILKLVNNVIRRLKQVQEILAVHSTGLGLFSNVHVYVFCHRGYQYSQLIFHISSLKNELFENQIHGFEGNECYKDNFMMWVKQFYLTD